MTYLNNNDHDQMGMLSFGDSLPKCENDKHDVSTENVGPKQKPRPTSILGECGILCSLKTKHTMKLIWSGLTGTDLQ